MERNIQINGHNRLFHYKSLKDIAQSGLLFAQVMCSKDEPIHFEKDRIDFILGVFSRDHSKFKHLIRDNGFIVIEPKLRYDLYWLYRNNQNAAKKPTKTKQPKKVNTSSGVAKVKNDIATHPKLNTPNSYTTKADLLRKNGFKTSPAGWVQAGITIKESFVQNDRTSLNVLKEIVDIKLQQIRNKYLNQKANKEKAIKKKQASFTRNKSQDAMDYRLPGSFGTGKRR